MQMAVLRAIVLTLIFQEGTTQNLALNKKIYSSNNDGNIYRVVDGNTNNNWDANSCSSISFRSSPTDDSQWILVDLGQRYSLQTVTIYNEYRYWNNSISRELHNFVIELFLSNPMIFPQLQSKFCSAHGGTIGITPLTLNCASGSTGRFLRLRKQDILTFNHFQVCEVEVAGLSPPTGDCSVVTFRKVTKSRLITASSPNTVYSSTNMECAKKCSDQPGRQGFNFCHVTNVCDMLMTIDVEDIITSDPNWQLNILSLIEERISFSPK